LPRPHTFITPFADAYIVKKVDITQGLGPRCRAPKVILTKRTGYVIEKKGTVF